MGRRSVNESAYIDRLIRWLRLSGARVHPYAVDMPFDGGFYRSETKEVFLNVPSARGALLTLAHEAGHFLGYEVFGEKRQSYQRERQAFVYGWRALVLIGADRIISRSEWIEDERARRRTPQDADTGSVKSRPEELPHEPMR